jgi:topoisomerase-4 subunit A
VRVVLEPKSRNVDAAVLMESLFRQTDLEVRISLNMNVLDADSIPRVMDLKEVLRAFLDHREVVLQRRSRHRIGVIERRLEVLQGHLAAFLNLDEVIRIIREEDEPKPVLMARFSLTDPQAEAILNMRLRNLRKLEEMEIRSEFAKLIAERDGLATLLGNPGLRWQRIGEEVADMRRNFADPRRTRFAVAGPTLVVPVEAMVEREAITVVCSDKLWVRAVKGHDVDPGEIKYKDGDGPRILLKAETTDKLLLFATDGRCYTLGADKLTRGRGFGEPLRLAIDLGQEHEIVAIRVHRPGGKLLLASDDGRGFQVLEDETVAQTRTGKQVLLPAEGARAAHCLAVVGDAVAVIGQNRKLLVFKLDELPVMTRGRGVMLQRYGDGGMSDLKVITLAEGLVYPFGNGTRTVSDLLPWLGKRASAGRLPPPGFPRSNRFS